MNNVKSRTIIQLNLTWSASINLVSAFSSFPAYYSFKLDQIGPWIFVAISVLVGLSFAFYMYFDKNKQTEPAGKQLVWILLILTVSVWILNTSAFISRPRFHILKSETIVEIEANGNARTTRFEILEVKEDMARMAEEGIAAQGGIKYEDFREWKIEKLISIDPISVDLDANYDVIFEKEDFDEGRGWVQTRFEPELGPGYYRRTRKNYVIDAFPTTNKSDWYAVKPNYFTKIVALTIIFPKERPIQTDVKRFKSMSRGELVKEPAVPIAHNTDFKFQCEFGPCNPCDKYRIVWTYRKNDVSSTSE